MAKDQIIPPVSNVIAASFDIADKPAGNMEAVLTVDVSSFSVTIQNDQLINVAMDLKADFKLMGRDESPVMHAAVTMRTEGDGRLLMGNCL